MVVTYQTKGFDLTNVVIYVFLRFMYLARKIASYGISVHMYFLF